MDKPHKKAFDHCLHCPHFSDLIDHTDLSLSDLPDKILAQDNNEFPVKKIPGEQYNLATDAVTTDFKMANKRTQSMGDLPRDDELLKEILGEDYATQSLPGNKLYRQKDFTGVNNTKLSSATDDEAEIDKIIEGILKGSEQDESLDGGLSGELDIGSVNSGSTDIDEFLQKYLTDDSPEITQNEPSEITDGDLSGIIDDSSSEITDDLTGIIDDASSKITDEESAGILDDLSEVMGGESSEIIDELSGIIVDETPEIIVDSSEDIDDVAAEIMHIGKETNIDELIESILNDDISSENLFEENSLAAVDRKDTDIQMERTELETKPRAQAEHSTQRTPAQKITNMPSGYNSTSGRNIGKKTEDYKFPQAAPANYRVPAIALFILIVVVGLVWYLVTEPGKEPTRFTEVESREAPEIKSKSAYYEEVSPDPEQVVSLPEEFPQPFYAEPSLVQPETEVPVVDNTVSIITTDNRLYEQDSYPAKDKLTEDMSTVEAENKVNEIEPEIVEVESKTSEIEPELVEVESKTSEIEHETVGTENIANEIEHEAVIFSKTDDIHIEVSDEANEPAESLSTVESIPPQQESLRVESEKIVIIDKLEFGATADTPDAGDEINKPAESTSKGEAISAEHALADNIQRNLAAAKEGDTFWALNLSSVYKKKTPVNSLLDSIRSTGIPAEIKEVFIDKSKWYRIRIIGFSSYAEAKGFMQEVTDKTDIQKYWISQVVVDSAYLKNLPDNLSEIDN